MTPMSPWTNAEWQVMRAKLEKLTIEQLKVLTVRVGIRFSEGVNSVQDRPSATAKEQLLLVLDETDPIELKREYACIVDEKLKG